MELVFIINQGFQLHASVINWKDKGILFSAPSGTGKSTQADLWKKYEGAKVINGDRALIRKRKRRVYGLWFSICWYIENIYKFLSSNQSDCYLGSR